MTEPIKPDLLFRIEAKSPEFKTHAELLQEILNTPEVENRLRDLAGIPRIGRQPDYLNGRWCIGCHNSLPDDWRGPCDVCGKVNESISMEGLLADSPETASQPLYRGIPRA